MACWGVTFGAVFGLVLGTVMNSDFFMLISVLGAFASSLYLRIAQMHRCNDIGWPWVIPWIIFGLGLAISVISQLAAILALVMLPAAIIFAVIDFAFGVVVGFIPSRQIAQPDYDPQAYRDAYADYGAPNYSAAHAAEAAARKNAAAAQMGIDRPAMSASGKRVASVTQAEAEPALPPRAMGFGRKGIAG
jgi:hypothetical protein